jgi:hypothetical protein
MRFLADGAQPETAPLPPLKQFLSDRIMERMRGLG